MAMKSEAEYDRLANEASEQLRQERGEIDGSKARALWDKFAERAKEHAGQIRDAAHDEARFAIHDTRQSLIDQGWFENRDGGQGRAYDHDFYGRGEQQNEITPSDLYGYDDVQAQRDQHTVDQGELAQTERQDGQADQIHAMKDHEVDMGEQER